MKNKKPKVSIIMGIYNCEDTLEECIKSILNQTYDNWELIMCDDCSKDRTFEIASKYERLYPDKIKLIQNKSNLTLAPSLNRCLELVSGKYVARQDGDDLSHKDRIKKQVEFLENNIGYDLVGTNMISFNEIGETGIHKLKQNPDKNDLIYGVTFSHATILIKSSTMKELGGYCEEDYAKQLEDYELWSRFFEKNYKGYNLDEGLYYVREDKNAYKRRNIKRRLRGIKLRLIVSKRLKFSLKGNLMILKDIIAIFIPQKIFEFYYRRRLLKNNT